MLRALSAHSQASGSTRRNSQRSHQSHEDRRDDNVTAAAATEPCMKCMSVVADGTRIAFACYHEDRNEIMMEESNANGYDSERVIESFVAVARPTLILVGSKTVAKPALLQILTQPAATAPDEDFDDHTAHNDNHSVASHSVATSSLRRPSNHPPMNRTTPYKVLKSGAFEPKTCKMMILQKLRVLSLMGRHHRAAAGALDRSDRSFPLTTTQGAFFRPSNYHAMASLVDLESKVQVQALGSLLSFLQSTVFQLEQGGVITVSNLFHCQSSAFMRLDNNTLSSLRIFATEHHPLVTKGPGNSKEGFSLFSLLDKTRSRGGRQQLREWMLKPLLDPTSISKRQDGIELFIRPDMADLVGGLLNLLDHIGPIDKILIRMNKCHTQPNDFLILTRTISAVMSIWNLLANELHVKLVSLRESRPPTIDEQVGEERQRVEKYITFIESIVASAETSILTDLQERVTSVIDEDSLVQTRNLSVRFGYHDELDIAKEKFECLEETLAQVGATIIEKYPSLPSSGVIFIPQVGFLVALHTDNNFDISVLPEDFDHIFNENNQAFFKNDETKYLDDTMGDLHAFIKDTESLIIAELEDDILECEPMLRDAFQNMAELDCILSLANCATDMNFVRPEVVESEEHCIYVLQGKHPLQELIVEREFIPNDVVIDSDNRVNVVTGPNYSGKSCYVRQVGILVYLAHIGSFLPCKKAKISITDQIFARISTVETCAVPQSSFQLDLTQMATILRQSSERSLVIIDEFGKGTSPASGIAVLTAALRKLSALKCNVVCTTHFLEIFSLGLLRDSIDGVKALQMAVQLPRTTRDDAVPLFRLEEGVASASAGLVCAKTAGVDKAVIARAEEILDVMKEGRKLDPSHDTLCVSAGLSQCEMLVLHSFVLVDSWDSISDEQLRDFLQTVSQANF